jgi:hypothetical protein
MMQKAIASHLHQPMPKSHTNCSLPKKQGFINVCAILIGPIRYGAEGKLSDW